MLTIKPYGRSHTRFPEAGRARRDIHLNEDPETPRDIAAFATDHADFVRAQWISSLDKIATKPVGNRKPTSEQRRFRDCLGRAALAFIVERKLVPDLGAGREAFERVWWAKIHPYGEETSDERTVSAKGRWFERFAGAVEPEAVDADAVVVKLHAHLYKRELRLHADCPPKRKGRIASRAESIKGNVLAMPSIAAPAAAPAWSEADKQCYGAAGDVAAAIRRAASEEEKSNRRVSVRHAAAVLYGHHGRLFRGKDGTPLGVKDARQAKPGLFALHAAVKDTYSRILKDHRKLQVSKVLPPDLPALLSLVEAKHGNRDLNALVRLGKVLHYEATPAHAGDRPDNVFGTWPPTIEHSRFWTSEGQSEIKRNEALVRVWRGVIALATRTLTDWADPDGAVDSDILGSVSRVTGPQFDETAFDRKAWLLFGKRAGLFTDSGRETKSQVLKLALEGWRSLRNGSFHFKGRGGFTQTLTGGLAALDSLPDAAVATLWRDDTAGRTARLKDVMRASHFEFLFDARRLGRLFEALTGTSPGSVPLPRFRRVLLRAENAWRDKDFKLRLPAPGKRADLERPARLGQYQALKLLYERAFRAWLDDRSAREVNSWIERALARTTAMAKRINKDDHATARAATLPRLSDGQAIDRFFDRLAAATTTEFRVQRGYNPDPEKAREQSGFLDNLKCDVVAQAFEAYLCAESLDWLLADVSGKDLPETPLSKLEDLETPPADESELLPWQRVLYFLVHSVPVEEVGRLYHQLRKWSVLEGRSDDDVLAVQAVFDLYLDMHDAKFEGGASLTEVERLKPLFESDAVFDGQAPRLHAEDEDSHVPKRGLREMMRFATLEPLSPVFERCPVTADVVKRRTAAETENNGSSPVAEAQERRQDLHEKWVRQRRRLSETDKTDYCRALATVICHRQAAAQADLINHARLHRLLMQVLGRLLDYSGLWERDLYFVTLALIHLEGETPRTVFPDESNGAEALAAGRVVKALRRLETSEGTAIMAGLDRYFGADALDGGNGKAGIRNDLAHFNLLRDGTAPNLTKAVNRTRSLMSHDRKLKNAVSKSVVELLGREGLTLTWEMRGHDLAEAGVATRQATHLATPNITENLHGPEFVSMVAALFKGEVEKTDDILSLDLDRVSWGRHHAGRAGKNGKKSDGKAPKSRSRKRNRRSRKR